MFELLDKIYHAETENIVELAKLVAPGDKGFFKGANFDGIDITGLDLSWFDLAGASFKGVILDEKTILPILKPQAYVPVIDALNNEISGIFVDDFDPDRHIVQIILRNSANQAIDYNDGYFGNVEFIYKQVSGYRRTLHNGSKVVFADGLRNLSRGTSHEPRYVFEHKGNAIPDPEGVLVEFTLRDNKTKLLTYNTTALNLQRQLIKTFRTYRKILIKLHPDNSL